MTDHDADALLEQVLTGERSERDPEVAAALTADPALRSRLHSLQRLTAQLDVAGDEQQRELAELAAGRQPGRPRVDFGAVVRAQRRRRWLVRAAAAAAAVLLAALAWWANTAGPPPTQPHRVPNDRLGGAVWSIERPTAAPGLKLRWHDPAGQLLPGERYSLRVYRTEDDLDPAWPAIDLGTEPFCLLNQWPKDIPDSSFVEVVVLDADDKVVRRSR